MKPLTRKGVEELIPYSPGKPIEELEREFGIINSIKLASNENPLGPSPKAIDAITHSLGLLHRYPDGSGYYLKTKLSDKFGLSKERIIIGNGSNEIIELIIRTFLSPGDNVVQAYPTFLVYDKVVKGAGGEVTSVPLVNYKTDLEGVLGAINERTKVVFINNPNNPTGSVLSSSEMRYLLDNVPSDIIVAIDEAYIEFVTDLSAANGLELIDKYPNVCVLRTFSKLYGLAGLRIGYGFSSELIVDYMNRVRQPFNTSSLAQIAATTALDDIEFVGKTLETVRNGLSYLYCSLSDMGIEYIPTQTNFFLIKVPGGGKHIYEMMLKEGVIVRSMESYALPEYIRVSIGLQEENERFIYTLKKVLYKLR